MPKRCDRDDDCGEDESHGEHLPKQQPQPALSLTVEIRSRMQSRISMPLIGLGTFRAKGRALVEAVRFAITACGIRLIDTAEGYKNAAFIAEGIAKSGVPREAIFITSKVAKESMTPQGVRACVAQQAECFGGYIDLMLLHWPGTGNNNPTSKQHQHARIACWAALQEALHDQNSDRPLVRAIGVSNFSIEHIAQLLAAPSTVEVPSVNQVEVHPFLPQAELRSYCNSKGIVVQGYTTLGRSTEPPKCLYGNWEPDLPRLVVHPVVVAIAKECNRSCAQVLLRWSLLHGIGVIPKSLQVAHIQENSNLMDFCLTAEHMRQLDALDAHGAITYAYRPEKVPR